MLSEQSPQRPLSGMLQPGYLSQGQAARAVEQFLRSHLPDWVNGQQYHLQQPENKLTTSLCLFLYRRCRTEQTLFFFFHEFPQPARRSVDLSVHLYVVDQILEDPFYLLEAKRLPTPGTGREREYVVGDGSKQYGGIERFKENLHGDGLLYAGMIAYIQKDRKPFLVGKRQPVDHRPYHVSADKRPFDVESK